MIFRFARKMPTPWLLLSDIGGLGFARPASSMQTTGTVLAMSTDDPTPAQSAQQSQALGKKPRPVKSHAVYLRELQERQAPRDAIESFASGYQDHLQNPLQPLADNLESLTYEVFEQDPIKYEWYERAIASALRDWKTSGRTGSGRNGSVCIAVVGAGRGPIVTRALQASTLTGVEIDLWAVEKNQNAFVLLQRHFHGQWKQRVSLVRSDMRSWNGPFHYSQGGANGASQKVLSTVDILVSELLGSFADNELSPECLDGVQHLLTPQHGISIPTSYTAHLTPIAAPKLHSDISFKSSGGDASASQVPYVVLLHAIDHSSTHLPAKHQDRGKNPNAATPRPDPQPIIKQAWEFSHPNPAVTGPMTNQAVRDNEHNRRFTKLEFPCRNRGVCHGLGGYFETVLYQRKAQQVTTSGTSKTQHAVANRGSTQQAASTDDKVELSTNPLTMAAKSKDMISWFPIYFPLKVCVVYSQKFLSGTNAGADTALLPRWLIVSGQHVAPDRRSQSLVRMDSRKLLGARLSAPEENTFG